MRINQIYSVMNDINKQMFGADALAVHDLSGLISMGKTIANAVSYDKFLNIFVDRIGKTIIRRLNLQLEFPSLFMNEFEFGAVLQKITVDPVDASNNSSWDVGNVGFTPTLLDIHKPSVSVKYFEGADTASFLMTIPFFLVDSAFTSEAGVAAFFDAVIAALQDSVIVSINNMSRTAVNNFVAEKIKAQNGVINLLTGYNGISPTPITQADAMHDPNFLRYASGEIKKYIKYMSQPSVLYNVDGKVRATSRDNMHVLCLTEFAVSSQVNLQADTYWKELLALPNYTEVAYWQGNHDTVNGDNSFIANSTINVIPSSEEGAQTPTAVNQNGVVMVLADRQAIAVGLNKRRSATFTNTIDAYTNMKEEFTTQWINDVGGENGLIFVVA